MQVNEKLIYKRLKSHVDGFYTRIENAISSGIPDVIAIINSKTIFIELKVLKSSGIYFLPSQIIWQLDFQKASGNNSYVLVGSRDDVIRLYDMATIIKLKRVPFNGYFLISLESVRPVAIGFPAINSHFNPD